MPSRANVGPEHRGIDWPAVVRTLLIQVVVLLALAGAFIGYVEWSSNRAVAEFTAVGDSPALERHQPLQSLRPIRTAKAQATCDRRN